MSMDKKNPYRVILNAVLQLPWGEGLNRYVALDRNTGLCCAIGTVMFGDVPMKKRSAFFGSRSCSKSYNRRYNSVADNIDVDVFCEIGDENDRFINQSPLARKHRMIEWLRERADETDRSSR